MQRKPLLQLGLFLLVGISALAFLNKRYRPHQPANKICCQKNCPGKKSDSSTDNIFYNPIHKLIVGIYN